LTSHQQTIFVGYGTLVLAWGGGKWATVGDTTFGGYTTDGFTFWDLGGLRAFWWRPHHFGDQLFIPLWLIAITLALPPAYLEYRRRKKPQPGCCVKCGYDRAGLAPDAKCPECGRTA